MLHTVDTGVGVQPNKLRKLIIKMSASPNAAASIKHIVMWILLSVEFSTHRFLWTCNNNKNGTKAEVLKSVWLGYL